MLGVIAQGGVILLKNVYNMRLIVCEYSTAGNNKRQHYSRSAAATEKFSITIITFFLVDELTS